MQKVRKEYEEKLEAIKRTEGDFYHKQSMPQGVQVYENMDGKVMVKMPYEILTEIATKYYYIEQLLKMFACDPDRKDVSYRQKGALWFTSEMVKLRHISEILAIANSPVMSFEEYCKGDSLTK